MQLASVSKLLTCSVLCVVDGGKGIRKALVDVLGDLAVIQRCQIHKLRNLRSYLPKSRHAYVLQTMKEAYKSKSADKARKKLRALVSWLERNGYDEAAGSLREGMEETLTVVKLALPESLRKSLATTNSIENLNGTIRRVSRNVKRWKSPSMIRRWTALGVVTAEKKFRRIKGYRHMGQVLIFLSNLRMVPRARLSCWLCLLFIHPRALNFDWSPVCRHHAYMISSFVRGLISAFKARRELALDNVALRQQLSGSDFEELDSRPQDTRCAGATPVLCGASAIKCCYAATGSGYRCGRDRVARPRLVPKLCPWWIESSRVRLYFWTRRPCRRQ